MVIVKFNDGQYGVRKGRRWFGGYEYACFTGDYWFSKEDHVNRCCKMSKAAAEKVYAKLTKPKGKRDYGTTLDEIYER